MDKKYALITGVAGLIGSRLADWIIENKPDYCVVGVDNLFGGYEENINKNVIFYNKELSSDDLSGLFEKYNFEYVFEDINNIMKKSNVNFYTQQGILGGKDLGLTSYTNFNTPYDTATELAKVGFNTISLASYHANDRGVQGITNAINFLNENKISYSGISLNEEDRLKNSIIEKNGIKVALLGYTMGSTIATNNTYSVSIYSEEQVKKDYDAIKDQADIIMVAIDYSNNRSLEVTEQEKTIANYLANLGVDIVIGNTGYSVQPIEKINNTLVFYSLGNMLSGHSLTDNKISAIVDFKYTIKEKGGNIEKLKQSDKYLLNILNRIIDGKKNVSLTKLYNFCDNKKDAIDFLINYNVYIKMLRNESTNEPYFETKLVYNTVSSYKTISYILWLVSLVFTFYEHYSILGYLLILISYFVNELFLNCYKRTKKANDLYFDYIAYKNYLEEIDTLGYDKNDINTYITNGLILKTTNTNLKLDQGEFPYKLNKAIVRCVKKANDRR